MRVVVQRVARAKVTADGAVSGEIGPGLLLLVGIGREDDEERLAWMARKIAGLRVFPDGDGRMNRSLLDTGGGALAVSQFTLYGDASAGRRPGFAEAAPPDAARPLFERFCALLEAELGRAVARGVFRAHMDVESVNSGPVTLLLER